MTFCHQRTSSIITPIIQYDQEVQCKVSGHNKEKVLLICTELSCECQRLCCGYCTHFHPNHIDKVIRIKDFMFQTEIAYSQINTKLHQLITTEKYLKDFQAFQQTIQIKCEELLEQFQVVLYQCQANQLLTYIESQLEQDEAKANLRNNYLEIQKSLGKSIDEIVPKDLNIFVKIYNQQDYNKAFQQKIQSDQERQIHINQLINQLYGLTKNSLNEAIKIIEKGTNEIFNQLRNNRDKSQSFQTIQQEQLLQQQQQQQSSSCIQQTSSTQQGLTRNSSISIVNQPQQTHIVAQLVNSQTFIQQQQQQQPQQIVQITQKNEQMMNSDNHSEEKKSNYSANPQEIKEIEQINQQLQYQEIEKECPSNELVTQISSIPNYQNNSIKVVLEKIGKRGWKYELKNKYNITGVKLKPYIINSDQSVYDGEWKNKERNGLGKIFYKNGAIYEGYMLNDKIHGWGRLIEPSGDIFEGEFIEGKKTGLGFYFNLASDYWHEGNYQDGLKNGQGVESSKDGTQYQGEYQNNVRHGKGILTDRQGIIYEGQFNQGKKNGYGKLIYPGKGIYEGEFVNDLIEGYGKFIYENNEIYTGQFKAGKKHGKGKIQLSNGNMFEGDWIQEKMNIGTLIFPDNSVKYGKWINGKFEEQVDGF